jgi:predicted nucleic acid-binding Zn ribbon protein
LDEVQLENIFTVCDEAVGRDKTVNKDKCDEAVGRGRQLIQIHVIQREGRG